MNANTLVLVPKQSLGKGLGFPLRSEPSPQVCLLFLKSRLCTAAACRMKKKKKERIVTVFIIAYNLLL